MRRLAQALVVIVIVSMLVFILMRVVPGDPLYVYLGDDISFLTAKDIEAVRHELGLDKSLAMQYVDWMQDMLHGDFGYSIRRTRRAVMDMITERVPVTFHLGLLAFLISFIGIPMGVVAAVKRAKWWDTIVTVAANIGIAMPSFWLGILLMYAVGLKLKLLPLYGYTSPFIDFSMSTRQIIMPVFVLASTGIAASARQTRSAMLEVIHQDYTRTAWSKGLRERTVVIRHVLKNGLLPVITLKGMTFRNLLGGSVLVETVFNIPGMGRLAAEAVIAKDYLVVQAVILLIAVAVVLGNLLTDLVQGWLDPRIRFQ
ncbi:MAG: ABC transporter permease [Chloroflexi bacterium]|nr:ABC transporter permease [Chloroflexota bacterium]